MLLQFPDRKNSGQLGCHLVVLSHVWAVELASHWESNRSSVYVHLRKRDRFANGLFPNQVRVSRRKPSCKARTQKHFNLF